MPSSTSSSDSRAPDGPWRATWLLAAGMVVLPIAGWELFWRGQGLTPAPRDGAGLWCRARRTVESDSVVLLGASRIQTGVSPSVVAQSLGRRVVQLAISGSSPLPLLKQLAGDESFRGTVIVDLIPRIAFDETREREAVTHEYIRRFEGHSSPSRRSEAWLGRLVQQWCVFRHPGLSPQRIARDVLEGRQPAAPFDTMQPDRFQRLDFTKTDPAVREQRLYDTIATHGRASAGEALEDLLAELKQAAVAIQNRGGRVVFVRMPIRGRIRAVEEKRYPRARYWDRLVAATEAVAIHYEDHPQLNAFDCPDGSHLDVRDVERFTRGLCGIILDELSTTGDEGPG